jgi:hypothetical protein
MRRTYGRVRRRMAIFSIRLEKTGGLSGRERQSIRRTQLH